MAKLTLTIEFAPGESSRKIAHRLGTSGNFMFQVWDAFRAMLAARRSTYFEGLGADRVGGTTKLIVHFDANLATDRLTPANRFDNFQLDPDEAEAARELHGIMLREGHHLEEFQK